MPKVRRDYKDEADHIAAKRGGRCLSAVIPTFDFKAVWKCSNPSHPEWTASFASVKGHKSRLGSWCDGCFRERRRMAMRLSLDKVRAKLKRCDIELVSESYTGIETPISCRCVKCGHPWPTRLRHINHGHGCPKCGKKRQAESKHCPIEKIVTVLKRMGITVLAIHRDKPRTRIDFRCDTCGVEDSIFWNDLRRRGCPRCGRRRGAEARKHSYDYVRNYLHDLRIVLLSKEYKDSKSQLHVRFRCGCEDDISFNSIQRGTRCGDCAPNARVTLEDYQELARSHGGKLLMMARTTTQPAQWKCAKKSHPSFWRSYNVIKKNTFCPECSEGFSERICRTAAQQLFGVPFKKSPLPIQDVQGVGGRNLRFDAYSASLQLAIEHNGSQHYQPVRFGNQTQIEAANSFRKQQEHDRRRQAYCKAKGITLIEVPELGRRTKIEDLKEFIRTECLRANFRLPESFDRVHLKLDVQHLTTTAEEMWARILKRVRKIGYILKSKIYPGANSQLSLLCRNSHPYTPRVASFLNGQTCRRCYIQQLVVPVLVLPLGPKAVGRGYSDARVFDSIEECANALGTSPNNVQIVAKGRGKSCMGFGVVRVTPDQAKSFRENNKEREQFCRAKWPSPESYNKQDGSRKLLSQPVQLSDGREFPSKTAAAKALGVTEAAVYHAVRTGSLCRGLRILKKAV